MKIEKHLEALREVEDEINSSLEDPDGLIKHQRRLAFMISMGIAELIEIYFHRLDIMKEGSRIKHEWLKKKSIKDILSNQIVKPINSVECIDKIFSISKEIEDKRNDLAYSSPLEEEDILKEEINQYFQIKKIVEKIVGDLNV
ncbi:MAG: hypothetical protein ISS36_04210 [Candidatus Aenigmarchaeota archaeon]|nr:hypothetical protein [Candidatus Aenigmarchaeota archaeon]